MKMMLVFLIRTLETTRTTVKLMLDHIHITRIRILWEGTFLLPNLLTVKNYGSQQIQPITLKFLTRGSQIAMILMLKMALLRII